MLKTEWQGEHNILIITPEGRLEAEAFVRLAQEVDPYLEEHAHAGTHYRPTRGTIIKKASLIAGLFFLRASKAYKNIATTIRRARSGPGS